MKPDLLESIPPADVVRFLADDAWRIEEKLDGIRCLVSIADGRVTFLGRNGQELGDDRSRRLPDLALAFRMGDAVLPGTWVFDGELLSDGTWHVFDLCRSSTLVGPSTILEHRRTMLEVLWSKVLRHHPRCRLVRQAATTTEKVALWAEVQAAKGEGIVLKRVNGTAPLTGKRQGSGLKAKLVKELDAVVLAVGDDGKESCRLGLYSDGRMVEIGRSSLIGKGLIEPGDVVLVRYLYVGAGGRLYQPRLLAKRTDKTAAECSINQLA